MRGHCWQASATDKAKLFYPEARGEFSVQPARDFVTLLAQ